jgi:hypothetical protein
MKEDCKNLHRTHGKKTLRDLKTLREKKTLRDKLHV